MVKTAIESLREVDIILFMVEPHEVGGGDRFIIKLLKKVQSSVFLLINKIDTIKKSDLLPLIDNLKDIYPFREIIPVSALTKDGTELLLKG